MKNIPNAPKKEEKDLMDKYDVPIIYDNIDKIGLVFLTFLISLTLLGIGLFIYDIIR